MGRGLSELQRSMLALALGIRRRGERSWGDLSATDVLVVVYGFPVARSGIQQFDRAAIGHGRHNAAAVSVSRALARLEKRGLVERPQLRNGSLARGYVVLTPAGVAVAETLPPVEPPAWPYRPSPPAAPGDVVRPRR